jgi:hypothetical protein
MAWMHSSISLAIVGLLGATAISLLEAPPTPAHPAPKAAIPLPAARMELGGIRLEFTEAQVRQKLGPPSQVDELDNPLLGGKERYLLYMKQGIQGVQLIQDAKTKQYQVFSVLAIDAAAATPDGVKPGDPVATLLRLYGPPAAVENQGNVDTLYYKSDQGIPSELAFTVPADTNRITEIRLSRRVPQN